MDKEFWENTYKYIPEESTQSSNMVKGWVCNFFPFITKVDGTIKTLEDNLTTQRKGNADAKDMFTHRLNKQFNPMKMNDTEFTRGLQSTPL